MNIEQMNIQVKLRRQIDKTLSLIRRGKGIKEILRLIIWALLIDSEDKEHGEELRMGREVWKKGMSLVFVHDALEAL